MENTNKFFNIQGAGGPPPIPPPRIPIEAQEGVTGILKPTGLVVSLTEVEVLDLISEGEIEGLVTGEYVYQGTLGATGYSSATFIPFPIAPNTNVRYLRSIYWDTVPVVAPSTDGTSDLFNFQQIDVAFTPGLPLGSIISQNNSNLSNSLTISRTISERLRGGVNFQKIYRILNKDCQSANLNIKITQLSVSDVNPARYGDIKESTVKFTIYYRPLFNNPAKTILWSAAQFLNHSILGKISYGYIDSIPIPLSSKNGSAFSDSDFIGWEIKVVRITADSITSTLRNQTYVDSLTEIYGDIYSYPNSAIVAQRFSAEFFSQVPNRAFDTRLLKVAIPSNYDPIKKVYGEINGGPIGTSDIWDGTFKANKEWTDNPAWCLYDLMTNKRYGLGKYIDTSLLDKWSLYEISQYCDVLVPNGLGGIEPRFTCNLVITSRDQAYTLINNFASIFRAMLYYGAGTLYTVQDSPKDPLFQFTNDNVENGDFTYSTSSKRVRHTVAIVQYNDKTNFYAPTVEYVEDIDGIRKYGIRELQVAAFGCTSRGQAIRFGRWGLKTEKEESESVSFVAGLEGSYIRPGDIFQVYDSNRKTQRQAGRTYGVISNPTGAIITLDSVITGFIPNTVYNFALLCPTYNYDSSLVNLDGSNEIPSIRRVQIQTVPFSGIQTQIVTGLDNISRSQIVFNTSFNTSDYVVNGNMVFTIETSGNQANLSDGFSNQFDFYRALKIEEKDDNKFLISAIEYSATKFDEIESGLSFSDTNYLLNISSPKNLVLTQQNITPDANAKLINYSFTMDNLSGVQSFGIYAKTGAFLATDISGASGSQFLINILPVSVTSGTYIPFQNADYNFRVYAKNSIGQLSQGFAANDIIISNINPLKDVIISSLELQTNSGINAAGTKSFDTYSVSSPTFTWQLGLSQTIVQSTDVSYRITIRQPSSNNIPSNNIYFSVTGYNPVNSNNPTYSFDIGDNINSISTQNQNGPFRTYDIIVEAMTSDGNSSAGGNFITNGDSFYNNPNGYDILNVDNPKITGVTLSTGDCLGSDAFCSQQWITSDGDIKVYFSKFPSIPDLQGCYIYSCPSPFSQDEARGIIPTTKTIQSTLVSTIANPIDAVTFLTGVSYAYIALSPFDTFDKAILDKGQNIASGLYVSNVVKTFKIGINESLLFKNWLEVNFGQGFFDSTLTYTGEGISSIVVLPMDSGIYTPIAGNITTNTTTDLHVFEIHFTQILPTSAYTILHVPKPNAGVGTKFTFSNNDSLFTEPLRAPDKYTLAAQGVHFFGVLLSSTF